MADETQERYSHGYDEASKHMAERAAFTHLGFLLPHLGQDMSI